MNINLNGKVRIEINICVYILFLERIERSI